MCHETQHATYYCVSWQIFRKNLCFPVTTSNYPEEAASRGTYEKNHLRQMAQAIFV
jgi:hypothetical protein